jgi:hypothetical protein
LRHVFGANVLQLIWIVFNEAMLTPQTSTEGLNTAQPSLKDPPSLNLAIDDDGEWKPHLYAPFSLALTTILLAAV